MNYGGKGDYEVQRAGTISYHGGKELRDLLKEKHISVKHDILITVFLHKRIRT